MSAQHQFQSQTQDRATQALRLLEANQAYHESNDPVHSHPQRLAARNRCREWLHDVLSSEPAHPAALGLLGRVAMDDGNLDNAASLFQQSLEADPRQPQQYTNLGYWALRNERPTLAEKYFEQALKLDAQSAAAFCGVAHARRQRGEFDVAYLHYRSLANRELDWPTIYSGMLTCATHLTVEQADQSLAEDAIRMLRRDDLPHQELNGFVSALIRQRYDLDNPNADVFLDAASQDELLLLALEKTLLPDPAVEGLITRLRQSIVAEVAQTAELRDELHPLVSSLAIYAERTGYALLVEEDEVRLVDAVNQSITAQLAMGESLESIAGSVMISALYGALFHQSFAPQLGQWKLTEWPLVMQPMMAASYYHRATEEAVKQNFAEKAEELRLERSDVPQAWPSWRHLSLQTETSLRQILSQRFQIDTVGLPETLRMMVCGAESGQRALELAAYLSDVEVVAVDESLSNIAQATRRADEMGLDNIVFWPWSLARQFVADGHSVNWIEVGRLPSQHMTDLSLAAVVEDATQRGAVVHLNTCPAEQTRGDHQIRRLIEQHQLDPTATNLRRLRRMVMNNHQDPLWQDLLGTGDFYALGGCRDRWYRPQSREQLHDMIGLLCNEVDWKLLEALDDDGHALATGPVQQQLQAEASGNPVQSVVGQPLTLYFQRRR
ncbi:tetratricopeptide repeat protein [Tamilnaduibacter salinus]|uniref:Tetratricopeptide repeat protein n=2 Tax=Tamilnaduibacter salinus TaxID=1484056 RepID=A0A2A2I7X2_9GAMM|nr:hypothetical protein [Tamilnaduibacter salinus]PAV27394.1 hypothetical protein CF392_00860 [Tamilnaduibacter salinus]PVY75506.1 tetratricopeptide repeat protein [Tamilnaduibacter salinus]